MSTLKHMTDKEDRSDEHSIASLAGETLNELTKPRLTNALRSLNITQNEAFNLMLMHKHNIPIDNRRASVISQTSYYNEQVIEPNESTEKSKTLKRQIYEPSRNKQERPASRNSYDSELSVASFEKKIPIEEQSSSPVRHESASAKPKKQLPVYNSIQSMSIEFP
jgi:antitoxin component of RelBE/YafQ-DinJ toxin-antitoxin module